MPIVAGSKDYLEWLNNERPKRVCEKSRDQKFRRPVPEVMGYWGDGVMG